MEMLLLYRASGVVVKSAGLGFGVDLFQLINWFSPCHGKLLEMGNIPESKAGLMNWA